MTENQGTNNYGRFHTLKYAAVSAVSALAGGMIAKKMYARKLTLGMIGGMALLYSVYKGCDNVVPRLIDANRESNILEAETMREKMRYDFMMDSVRYNLKSALDAERDARIKSEELVQSQQKSLEKMVNKWDYTNRELSAAKNKIYETQKQLNNTKKNMDDYIRNQNAKEDKLLIEKQIQIEKKKKSFLQKLKFW